MAGLLVAIIGDVTPGRVFEPATKDAAAAKAAAESLGAELAKRGARLLVYGGRYLEAEVVRGFVAAEPKEDRSILMWYSQEHEPPAFDEEAAHPKLFERRVERGKDWEIAFYRSLTRADAVILMGGGNATMIAGQVAIGTRMPILAFSKYGGGAEKVWNTLSAGEDLPDRDEIDLMAKPWAANSASGCIEALFAQHARRRLAAGAPSTQSTVIIGLLFVAALALVPLIWGGNAFAVWMLFLAPLLAGAAGAPMRQIVFRTQPVAPSVLVTIVIGLVAGGVAGILFVTAQLTADPLLIADINAVEAGAKAVKAGAKAVEYAQRTIPYAVAVGFIAGFTSDAVFGKLVSQDVVQVGGVRADQRRP
jgi:hypothetical protein